jgi:hypothetical protein
MPRLCRLGREKRSSGPGDWPRPTTLARAAPCARRPHRAGLSGLGTSCSMLVRLLCAIMVLMEVIPQCLCSALRAFMPCRWRLFFHFNVARATIRARTAGPATHESPSRDAMAARHDSASINQSAACAGMQSVVIFEAQTGP